MLILPSEQETPAGASDAGWGKRAAAAYAAAVERSKNNETGN